MIIAGAGGAAHLPGMLAAHTVLPVLGVPVESKALHGMDSLLSIVQMPGGVPVGTMAIGTAGATNAGLLAAAIVVGVDGPRCGSGCGPGASARRPRCWPTPILAPVTTVGILGGGQLGRMLALAGRAARHPVPRGRAGAGPAGRRRRRGASPRPTTTPRALAELARRCDVVTVELEGVPVDAPGVAGRARAGAAVARGRRRDRRTG